MRGGFEFGSVLCTMVLMLQSQLFTKTHKEAPSDEVSLNAKLLLRAGFVYKEMAGVYTLLPLGFRVMENIKRVIREELDKIGAQEMLMTALQKKEVWELSGRWDDRVVDDWFKTDLKNGTEVGLAFTHEEPLTNIMKSYVSSYKDLPVYAYQFQTKFRNELRAKSGILRGREFLMKDLYDFSRSKEEHEAFYEKMKGVYMRIFNRLGIGDKTYLTLSSGGSFSKYSFEFQTITEAGEDTILYDEKKKIAVNKDDYSPEIFKDHGLDETELTLAEARSAEVGDIYTLGEKYSRAIGLTYKDENGESRNVYMGSYGIGLGRLMGVIVEVLADEKGMVWPKEIAPYDVHIVSLGAEDASAREANEIASALTDAGLSVLHDDRKRASAGEKLADSDLIGIPIRVVVSDRTRADGEVAVKMRTEDDEVRVPKNGVVSHITRKQS